MNKWDNTWYTSISLSIGQVGLLNTILRPTNYSLRGGLVEMCHIEPLSAWDELGNKQKLNFLVN